MGNFGTNLRSSEEETGRERRESSLPRTLEQPRVLKVLEAMKSVLPNDTITRDWIPQPGVERLNPFVHFGWLHMPAGAEGRGLRFNEGVEIITFLAQGGYRHEDQHRGSRELAPGSVEYLKTGGGIWHQEHALKQEGFEAFQLTMSLPAKMKSADPQYITFSPDQLPLESKGDYSLSFLAGGGSLLKTVTPLTLVLAQVEAGARAFLPGSEGRQSFICVVKGKCQIGMTLLKEGELALLSSSEGLEVGAGEEALTLLLASGRPLRL
jgi:redox-sensitive bicupin YhaK (pirin superfamily)